MKSIAFNFIQILGNTNTRKKKGYRILLLIILGIIYSQLNIS